MTTESTPVTIHTHTGGTTTFVSGTPNEIQTLASDQAGDAVLGMAVLTDGTSVVLSATVGLFHYQYDNYDNRTAGYSSVQVTTIDDGVATTNTLSLGSPDDTSGGVNPNLAGRGTSAETGTQPASDFLDRENFAEDMQIVALSGGGYVIAETTVDDNIGPVNGNLYFAVFNSSGQPINSSGQVVGSPDWTLVNTVDPPNNPDNFLHQSRTITPTRRKTTIINWSPRRPAGLLSNGPKTTRLTDTSNGSRRRAPRPQASSIMTMPI